MYILVYVVWLVLNGIITVEVCLVGLVLTALIAAAARVLFDYTPKREVRLLKKVPLFVAYVFVLFWEIVKANWEMFSFILNEKREIEPVLVSFDSSLKTRFGRFMLANSITLTPGTITVEQSGERFTVHCLKRDMLDCSPDGVFQRWIRRLEA